MSDVGEEGNTSGRDASDNLVDDNSSSVDSVKVILSIEV